MLLRRKITFLNDCRTFCVNLKIEMSRRVGLRSVKRVGRLIELMKLFTALDTAITVHTPQSRKPSTLS